MPVFTQNRFQTREQPEAKFADLTANPLPVLDKILTEMENYFPTSLTIQYNSVAYINTSNTLRLFTEGEVYDVTNADLTTWSLNYDVITYQIGQGMFKDYYKGQEY